MRFSTLAHTIVGSQGAGLDAQEVLHQSISVAAFRDRFEKPAVPVVIRGGASDWPCSTWTIQSLCDRFSDKVIGRPGKLALKVGPHLQQILLSMQEGSGVKAPPYLFKNIWLHDDFPELAHEVRTPEFVRENWLTKPLVRIACDPHWARWMEMFVCGVGARFPVIHQDALGTHAWLAQIQGKKRFWLWSPQARPGKGALAPGQNELVGYGLNNWNQVQEQTDLAAAFPDDEPMHATLNPGDIIFIPSGWWHTVETLEPSINLSGNWLNQSNWPQAQVAALQRPDAPKLFHHRAYRKLLDRLYG
jgi:hypothetical protein